jgi:hypothetical protein
LPTKKEGLWGFVDEGEELLRTNLNRKARGRKQRQYTVISYSRQEQREPPTLTAIDGTIP